MSDVAPDFDAARRATVARYKPAGRFAYHYVQGKLRRDPVARALFDLARSENFGDVADLGCGRGQFAACLLQAGLAGSVTGLDCRGSHLLQARLAMQGLPFTACQQDLSRGGAWPETDTVMLIDVLYQLDTAAQAALLLRAAAAARRLVIIRTADPQRGFRSTVTRSLERGFRRVWPHAGAHVNARPTQELIRILAGCGLQCSVAPCWTGTPFSNVLIVARRDAGMPV